MCSEYRPALQGVALYRWLAGREPRKNNVEARARIQNMEFPMKNEKMRRPFIFPGW